jgi:GxxExxY protein
MTIKKTEHEENVRKIIRCAFDVYNELHGGLMESVYESALIYELTLKGFLVEHQSELPIYYKGIRLDRVLKTDVVVNKDIILKLKATDTIEPMHRKQLFTYLSLSHKPIGIILNFTNNGKVVFERYWYDTETNRCHAF